MEEFVYVVLAGVAIFFIAGLIAGIPPLQGQEEIETKTFFTEDFGPIGHVNKTFRRIRLGDLSIGALRGNKTVETIEEAKIENGYFSYNSRVIEFHSNNPEAAWLSFEVLNTNLYGKLKIIANGEEVISSKMMTGIDPKIRIENLKKGKNRIEIVSEGPGLRFWAPSIYELRDLELVVNDYGYSSYSKPFKVYDYELRGFSHGKVKFFVERALRNKSLKVNINGNEIYKENPLKRSLPYEVRFHANDTNLKLGENILKFSSGEGAKYKLSNADLKLFYYGNPERTVITREFQISDKEYNDLGKEKIKGTLSFDSKVFISNEMKIELENKTFEVYPESGKNKYFFDQDDLKKGTNTLRISTEGSFRIQNFKLKSVEKE